MIRRSLISIVLAIICSTLLAGCGGSLRTMNFLITVEDEDGQVLGAGVWQWREFVGKSSMELYEWDGEAFPITHPVYGKMYVIRKSNPGGRRFVAYRILAAYDGAFLIPQHPDAEYRRRAVGIGEFGFNALSRMMDGKRVTISPAFAPAVVQFDNDADRYTGRIVRTWSETQQPEVVLRFFAVPTKSSMKNEIVKHLPWLPQTIRDRNGILLERAGQRVDSGNFLSSTQLSAARDSGAKQ